MSSARRSFFGLGIVAGIGAVLATGLSSSPTRGPELVMLHTVIRREVRCVVQALGALDAASSITIASQLQGGNGTLVFLADEGEQVEAGALLARMDPAPFEALLRTEEGRLRETEGRIAQLEQDVVLERSEAERELRGAEFDLRVAQLDLNKLQRGDGPLETARLQAAANEAGAEATRAEAYLADLQRLAERGYANETEVAHAEQKARERRRQYAHARGQLESYVDYVLPALYSTAQATVERCAIELDQTRRRVAAKVARAEAALVQARREHASFEQYVAMKRSDVESTALRAPAAGLVVLREDYHQGQRRKPRVGDTIYPHQPIAYLPDLTTMVVDARVREIDLHRVEVDQPATIRIEAYPDQPYTGHVETVGVLAERAAGENYFAVRVRLHGSDTRLRPGMTARVTVHCRTVRDALAVPIHAIQRRDDGYGCYVRTAEGTYALRKLEVGVQTEDWAEIRGGLAPGEEVALSEPSEELLAGEPEPPE